MQVRFKLNRASNDNLNSKNKTAENFQFEKTAEIVAALSNFQLFKSSKTKYVLEKFKNIEK